MLRTIATRLGCWITLIALVVVFAAVERPVLGAEDNAPVKKVAGKKGRRLPRYYAEVITEKQRGEIYKIEDEYQPKIEALQKQLDTLRKERDEKISALLTAEQKKQIEAATAKAKANRKLKSKSPPKPLEQTPPTPATAPSPPPVAPAP
jgi:Fe2+ transport system protein B